MKLMTQSYNNGGAAYNAEAEETSFLHYKLSHRFNEPAEAYITLADPTGTIAQKYNDDANDVYLGAGKVTIEDPTGTDVYFGRIMKVTADSEGRTVELYCQDWLSQLNEEQITYDMRQDLDGAGLRESQIYPDFADTDGLGIYPAHKVIFKAFADDGGVFTDETTAANDTTANDMTLIPAAPAVNDAYYFGFTYPVTEFTLVLGTQGVWAGTMEWEYWDGAAWSSLTTQPVGSFSTFEFAPGSHTYEDVYESDWAETAVDGTTCYWLRARIATYTGITTQPKGTQAYGEYFVYDYDMSHDANEWNDFYMILSDRMAGSNTWSTGPYDEVVTGDGAGIDSDIGDESNLWVDDSNSHAVWDNDENWTQDYYFRVYLGHNTPSDFYTHDSISGASVTVTYVFKDDDSDAICDLQVYDNTAAGWQPVASIQTYDAQQGHVLKRSTFSIPTEYIDDITSSTGIVKVRFNVTKGTSNAYLYIYYIMLNVTVDTTGYSSAITIKDTNGNRLTTSVDLSAAATQVWDGVPYSIAQEIYKHIDSAETPGDLITDNDDIETLTCAGTIEHTSGISTRQYKHKTALEILQDLARQDKAEFWIALGSTTVNWKSTWNDGAADQTFSDTDVNSWIMIQDYGTLANKVTAEGMRIGDRLLSSSYTDATSTAKYNATRSRVVTDAGLVSEYDTLARATATVNQLANIRKILTAVIRGNTETAAHSKTCKLGYEVQITSSYLNLSSAWYIVQQFEYDSESHLTTLQLHPRVSQTGLQPDDLKSINMAMETYRHGQTEKYVPPPDSDVV